MWSGPNDGGRVRYSAYCSSAGVHSFELLTIDEDPVLESLRQGITAAALLLGMLTLRVLSKISGEFFGQQDHMQITFVQNMFWMV